MPKRVLILGGTRDAVELAAVLVGAGHAVTTSLAGVTAVPVSPAGDLRVGGFGGLEGLVAAAKDFDVIADAAHPFAPRISAHGAAAAERLGIPCLRLERPAWTPEAGDRWLSARDMAHAASLAPHGARLLLTIGRKEISPFLARGDLSGLIRLIEDPAGPVPAAWDLVKARPPFALAEEVALMREARVEWLVSKNAGGELTRAKLAAARELRIPVIMIGRPAKPAVPSFAAAQALAAALA